MSPEFILAVGSILAVVLSFAGMVVGHLVGRRAGLKGADAQILQAQTDARQAVSADWQAYSQELRNLNGLLAGRVVAVEGRADAADLRLASAEARTAAAEARAERAEYMYRTAVGYLRQLVTWCTEHSPIGEMPKVPIELQNDLP